MIINMEVGKEDIIIIMIIAMKRGKEAQTCSKGNRRGPIDQQPISRGGEALSDKGWARDGKRWQEMVYQGEKAR